MKTLLDKLGYKPGVAGLLWQVPEPIGPELSAVREGTDATFFLAFVRNRAELAKAAEEVAVKYRAGGHLWIAYPKKGGSLASDLDRDHGWERIAGLGLLAVTQVAVDEDWSALRFRYRDEIKKLTREGN
jgi:hypothetical protein